MKIVIAPDSFKESLTAAQAAAAICRGFAQIWPQADYVCVPMADGGDLAEAMDPTRMAVEIKAAAAKLGVALTEAQDSARRRHGIKRRSR